MSEYVFVLPCPMPEERRESQVAIRVHRFACQPTPQELLNELGLGRHLIAIIDKVDGPVPRVGVIVHVAKRSWHDRDDMFYHRHLCHAVSGYVSVNWNVKEEWAGMTDAEIVADINRRSKALIK